MESERDRTLLLAGLGLLALLGLFSLYLGWNRIFQVDEVQYACVARFLADGRRSFIQGVPTILVGPLTWIAGAASGAAQVLQFLRLPFVALMWVNATLLVKGGGFRLRSREGLLVLLLASTLAPMWDYGFEIRHDVVLVAGVLALFRTVRSEGLDPMGRALVEGALAALLQFIAFKAFMYTLPLLALGFITQRPDSPSAWAKRVAWLVLGMALGLLGGRLVHGLAGTWGLYWNSQMHSAATSVDVERFQPWASLRRLLEEAPLLACVGLAALMYPPWEARRGGLRGWMRAPWFPEWAFALVCLLMFLANPTPFPYNLIHLCPALFLLALRFREPFLAALVPGRRILLASAIALHAIPWGVATWRHVDMDNERQRQIIGLAEALTDPAIHRVFDGSGLVSTRMPIGEHWHIHTFTIRNWSDGTWTPVRTLLERNPTPVVLPNYRTDWLPKADKEFINSHYVALAEDIMVLGCIRPGETFEWKVLAEGRYSVTLLGVPQGGARSLAIDGRPAQEGIQVLSRGSHTFGGPAGSGVQVVWVGPNLQSLPFASRAPHPLFVNWY